MTPQPSEQPRTAAGRALLAWEQSDARPLDEFMLLGEGSFRAAILAIEAEAAAPDPADLTTPSRLGDYEIREGEYGPLAAPDPVASPAPLNVKRLARAIPTVFVDLSSMEARLALAEGILARLTGSPDPAALADRLVEEGRVSVWGRPGTKFTAKRAKAPETTDG